MPNQDEEAASNHEPEKPNEQSTAQEQPVSDPEPDEDEDEDYDIDYGDEFEESAEQPHEQAEPQVIPIETNEPGGSFFLNDCKDLPQEPLPVFTGESEREDEQQDWPARPSAPAKKTGRSRKTDEQSQSQYDTTQREDLDFAVEDQFPAKPDETEEDGSEFALSEFQDSEEEEEEEPEDEVEVTQSYSIKVRVGASSNKKITYNNPSTKAQIFHLESSDPDFLMIREPDVEVDAESVGKFQLKFTPVEEE